jgi:hypothetical protein
VNITKTKSKIGERDWHGLHLTLGERHENGEHNHRGSTPVVSCEERGQYETVNITKTKETTIRVEDVDLHKMRLTLGKRHENGQHNHRSSTPVVSCEGRG